MVFGCYFFLMVKIDLNGCFIVYNVVKYLLVKYYLKYKFNNVDLNGFINDLDGIEVKKEMFKKGRK